MGQITYFYPQSIFHIANITIINDSIKYYFKYFGVKVKNTLFPTVILLSSSICSNPHTDGKHQ